MSNTFYIIRKKTPTKKGIYNFLEIEKIFIDSSNNQNVEYINPKEPDSIIQNIANLMTDVKLLYNICGTKISEGYILKVLKYCTHFIVLYNETDNQIESFSLLTEGTEVDDIAYLNSSEPDYEQIYINLICSSKKGKGRVLLEFIIEWCKQKYRVIALSAIKNVLFYYPLFGFEHKNTCKDQGEVYRGSNNTSLDEFSQYLKKSKLEHDDGYKMLYCNKNLTKLF